MSLEALVRGHLSSDQQIALGDAAITAAMSSALTAYSEVNPRKLVEQVKLTGNAAPLPSGWSAEFSVIQSVERIEYVAPPIVPVEGEDGISIPFTVNQWQLLGGEYFIDLTHGLESTFLQVQTYESNGQKTEFGRVTPFTTNKIRVWVNAKPDARFAGTAIIERA